MKKITTPIYKEKLTCDFVGVKNNEIFINQNAEAYCFREDLGMYQRLVNCISQGRHLTIYRKHGMQMNYYTHLLLAEAFIEVPNDGQTYVFTFKDDNRLNLDIDNIIPITNKDRIELSFQKKAKCFTCKKCGKISEVRYNKDLCSECKKEVKHLNRKIKIMGSFPSSEIDFSKLTDSQKIAFDLRSKGYTYQEIAKEMLCTRQNVNYLIQRCLSEKKKRSIS